MRSSPASRAYAEKIFTFRINMEALVPAVKKRALALAPLLLTLRPKAAGTIVKF
jgi:hypothetical protein